MRHWARAAVAAIALGLALTPALASAPVEVTLQALSAECQAAIGANTPDAAEELSGPDLFKDAQGDLSVGWASLNGEFFKDADGEQAAAQAIAKACQPVAIVIYSGPTGGSERWFIRHDGFKVRHFRDSGLPGDHDKYWGWETVPFDYDPAKDYKPGE